MREEQFNQPGCIALPDSDPDAEDKAYELARDMADEEKQDEVTK